MGAVEDEGRGGKAGEEGDEKGRVQVLERIEGGKGVGVRGGISY